MKIKLTLLAATVLCAGCVQISGTRHTDGTLTISSTRLFWSSEGINFTMNDGTNLSVTLSVTKSSADAAAMAAVAEGAARGAASGALP